MGADRERNSIFDDATTVVAGHGPETEIGIEKESNQFFRVS
jgi:hydroxyacylglutathione hydrolase